MKILISILVAIMIVKPNSKPQEEFLASSEYEVLYGGAAGGGKTHAIVIDPLRYVEYSDYTAIIFRRTFTELDKNIVPLAKEIYGQAGATYNDTKHVFNFPSGARVHLGYMKTLKDWMNYQGTEFAGMYFDELTHFMEEQYVSLMPWNRSKVSGISPYIRATSNPGGPGHIWVKNRFVETCKQVKAGAKKYHTIARMVWQPYRPGPTYWYHNQEFGFKTSRKFIPARVFDNPDLLKKNPDYIIQLLMQPPRKRKALLEGDWDSFEGQFFDFDYEQQVIAPFQIEGGWLLVGSVDPGYSNYTSFSLGAMDFDENYYRIATYYQKDLSPTQHAKEVQRFIEQLPYTKGRQPNFIVADPYAWAKRDRHAIIESEKTFAGVFEEHDLPLTKANNDRVIGWWAMKDMMTMKTKEDKYKYFVFAGLNDPYIEQLISSKSSEKNPEDIEAKYEKTIDAHCLDEERYRCITIYKPRRKPEELRGWRLRALKKSKEKERAIKKSYMVQ